MATVTARLDDWLRDAIVDFWEEHDAGPSSALRRVAEEWWAMETFPRIRYRNGISGRRAVLQEGPDVWEVVTVARSYGADRQGFYDHFAPHVDRDALDQALAYADRFREEIDGQIEANVRLERRLKTRRGVLTLHGEGPDLRFLFDQHVSGPALRELRARGIDVQHVSEVGLESSDDADVFLWARNSGRIVVTRNYRDFAPLAEAFSKRGEDFPGVLFLASSVPDHDPGAHVRAFVQWLDQARSLGANPVRGSIGGLVGSG